MFQDRLSRSRQQFSNLTPQPRWIIPPFISITMIAMLSLSLNLALAHVGVGEEAHHLVDFDLANNSTGPVMTGISHNSETFPGPTLQILVNGMSLTAVSPGSLVDIALSNHQGVQTYFICLDGIAQNVVTTNAAGSVIWPSFLFPSAISPGKHVLASSPESTCAEPVASQIITILFSGLAETISIDETGFNPTQVTIWPGETVAWQNQTDLPQQIGSAGEPVPHQIFLPVVLKQSNNTPGQTFNQAKASAMPHRPKAQSEWLSDKIPPGETYTRTFTVPGTYPFYLQGQPGISGTVIVEEPPDILPDLTIESIQLDPATPQINEGFTVTVVAKNPSYVNSAAPVQVDWYLDEPAPPLPGQSGQGAWITSEIRANSSVTFATTLALTRTGAHTFYAQIDTGNAIAEIDEGNNILSQTFSIEQVPQCQLRPIIVPTSKVGGLSQGEMVTIAIQNSSETPDNFSFLHWDSTTMPSNSILEEALQDATKVENFKEPGDPSDVLINIGDWVESSTGANPSNGVRDAIDGLIGQEIIMPVWNDIGCPANCQGQGVGGQFRVMTFVVMKVTAQDLTGSPKTISFEFSRVAPEACPGDDVP